MKLRNKIFVYTTGLFILLLIAFAGAIYYLFADHTYERELDRLEVETSNMVTNLTDVDANIPVDDLLRAYVPSNGSIRVLDSDYNMMTSVTSGEQMTLFDVSMPEQRGRFVQLFQDDQTLAIVQEPMIWQDGQVVYVQVIENLSHIDETLNNLQLVLLFVVLIGVVPVVVSGKLLADLILGPIQSLIQTMNDIKESQTFKQIPLKRQSKDELYTMTETFNDMIALLQEHYEKQEQFVSNASHELRTPITVIESYANLVKRRGLERPEVIEEAIEAIASESTRMKDLTEQLLLLAKRDQDWQIRSDEVDLKDLLPTVSEHLSQGYHREIKVDANKSFKVETDEQKLTQLLYILLDNALKYSEAPVELVLSGEQKPVITIQDYGVGIPADHQSRVFERFYRVDEARNRQTGGSGLGLTLAKEITDALNIDLRLTSVEGQGATIKLYF
ncbi:sensor histidine kinase [Alkalibacillus haloalkaliphilus]|uniref:sensor histidine kinase n=1 Tax=Alkalibacillus haloalkaliphilus TaxID=94136 RepID=UPI002935B366|nr:ATP-binding protein [Alkalibacillus haloalkaliphilus]MDV2582333.1 ATP-binding protein [Alkalibacillus haloalkaliphilus]